jgi:hypothetical protein
LSTGEVEPTYSNKIACQLVTGGNLRNGMTTDFTNNRIYSANVHCKNITAFGERDGKINLTNDQQPFIFAFGPADQSLLTTDLAASIRRHEAYGSFWMSMSKASTDNIDGATVPSGESLLTMTNAGQDGSLQSDGDKLGPAHAVLMCGAFLLLFPFGVIVLRVFEKVGMHAVVQGIGVSAAVIGVGVGIYLSRMYKHVSSYEQ